MKEIFSTLLSTSCKELKDLKKEFDKTVPDHRHTMLEKQDKDEAIQKSISRRDMETTIVPPTCSGANHFDK